MCEVGVATKSGALVFRYRAVTYLFSLGLSFLICTVGCRTRSSLNPFSVSETLWHYQSCVWLELDATAASSHSSHFQVKPASKML